MPLYYNGVTITKSNHCAYDTHHHLVFPLKYRKSLLGAEVVATMRDTMKGIEERYDLKIEQLHVVKVCSCWDLGDSTMTASKSLEYFLKEKVQKPPLQISYNKLMNDNYVISRIDKAHGLAAWSYVGILITLIVLILAGYSQSTLKTIDQEKASMHELNRIKSIYSLSSVGFVLSIIATIIWVIKIA